MVQTATEPEFVFESFAPGDYSSGDFADLARKLVSGDLRHPDQVPPDSVDRLQAAGKLAVVLWHPEYAGCLAILRGHRNDRKMRLAMSYFSGWINPEWAFEDPELVKPRLVEFSERFRNDPNDGFTPIPFVQADLMLKASLGLVPLPVCWLAIHPSLSDLVPEAANDSEAIH